MCTTDWTIINPVQYSVVTLFSPNTNNVIMKRMSVVYAVSQIVSNTSILKHVLSLAWFIESIHICCMLIMAVCSNNKLNKCAKIFITHDRIITTQTVGWFYNFRAGERWLKAWRRVQSVMTSLYTTSLFFLFVFLIWMQENGSKSSTCCHFFILK